MRIFVLLSRVPYPLEKGDKLRAYHQVKELAKNHEVHLCCLTVDDPHPAAMEQLSQICSGITFIRLGTLQRWFNLGLAMLSNKPFQVHYFKQGHAVRKVHSLIREFKPDHIYCQLVRTTDYVKDLFDIPKTVDYQDAFSKGVERRIAGAPWWFKPILKAETKRLLAYENLIFEYFDHKTIISEQDRELIYHADRKKIEIIPNGVDTDYFSPQEREKDYDIVFTGNMNYPPNVSGAEYLANEIMPIIWKRRPKATLLISGANPHPRVNALAGANIKVTGWVDDIRSSYSSSKVFVAPMRIGTGMQNKILEAMAMELPCVTSELVNNAIKAPVGTTILISETPQQYASQILELLEDKNKAAEIGRAGREFVLNAYDWATSTAKLAALMQGD